MRILDILPEERVVVDRSGSAVRDKSGALRVLSELLAPTVGVEPAKVEALLAEREKLQSTGIGDGVAIPHTSLEAVTARAAALLLCPSGVPFDSIDGADANIILGVVGPKEATGEHLRMLARISRVLRDVKTREALLACESPRQAHELIVSRDQALG